MKCVLIVDDEPEIVTLVRMTLEGESIRILEAHTGSDAFQIAKEERPDLILLDVMMPGTTGLEVCKQLREDPATKDITVIMLTARAQPWDRDAGMGAGANGYVVKPFSPLSLLRKVDEVLGRACV